MFYNILMLKSIITRFPTFSSDLCHTFNNRIPAYIFKEVVKYCNSTPNPTINDFLQTIPSYYIKNDYTKYISNKPKEHDKK